MTGSEYIADKWVQMISPSIVCLFCLFIYYISSSFFILVQLKDYDYAEKGFLLYIYYIYLFYFIFIKKTFISFIA